jgi:hypothetical protein
LKPGDTVTIGPATDVFYSISWLDGGGSAKNTKTVMLVYEKPAKK